MQKVDTAGHDTHRKPGEIIQDFEDEGELYNQPIDVLSPLLGSGESNVYVSVPLPMLVFPSPVSRESRGSSMFRESGALVCRYRKSFKS